MQSIKFIFVLALLLTPSILAEESFYGEGFDDRNTDVSTGDVSTGDVSTGDISTTVS